ncbi:MAG: hypothetical protein ACTSUO_01215 [Candidatus Thorarchaeota archaeon]
MMRDSMVGLISGPWSRISSKITDTFGLDPLSCPAKIDSTKKTKAGSFGGWIEGSTFTLTQESLQRKVTHFGVLAREYMRIALSNEGFEKTVREDFALAYGAFWLPTRMLKTWYEHWEDYCRFRGNPFTGYFAPHSAFRLFQSFSGSTYFEKLLTEYILMKKNGLVLSENDYVQHMQERMKRFSVQLNKTDFSLIRRLIAYPNAKRAELAKETNTSIHWVSRRLAALQKFGVLQKHSEIFYPGLGMKQYSLLIHSEKNEHVFDFIKDSPFLYSANSVISGDYDLSAQILIPDNPQNQKLVENYLKIMNDHDFATELHEITSGYSNRCFDHFSTQRYSWELPWELFGPHLKRIHSEGLSKIMKPYMRPYKRMRFKIDHLDIKIIEAYQIGEPLRNVRAKIGIKYEKLVQRLNRLKREGLIQDKYRLHHCGLNETLLFRVPKKYSEAVTSWAQRLPDTKSMLGAGGELLLYLHLPDGGLQGIAMALKTLSMKIKPMLLDSQKLVGKWYSTNRSWSDAVIPLWDTEKQIWSSSDDEIHDWFDELPS